MIHPMGRILIPRLDDAMRIPENMLQSVGYIVSLVGSDFIHDGYDLEATCFFVTVPSEVRPNKMYGYLVTAKHVLVSLAGQNIRILVNKRGGGITVLPLAPWVTHPADDTVDCAVIPFKDNREADLVHIPVSFFATAEALKADDIGPGDEVYMPGLFTFAPGNNRVLPLLRHGALAMVPDSQIQVDEGFADVYLIEVRSIGGMSGSPVFVRKTITFASTTNQSSSISGVGELKLLGLMHGHWDIKESDKNLPRPSNVDRIKGVNMGIGVVVPADKIIETLNHPALARQRRVADEALRQAELPTPDQRAIR
jgi:hypothetical protein